MKTAILTFFFVLYSWLTAVAQTPPSFLAGNPSWTIYLETSDCEAPRDPFLLKYYLEGDTTINNTQYAKLNLQTYGEGMLKTTPVGGLRTDGKKVYFTGITILGATLESETLLYDFGAQTGDTIWHQPGDHRLWHSVVLGIDSVQINGQQRMRMEVDNNWFYFNPDYWVEGVGSIMNGLLGHVSDIPTCGSHFWEHVCYQNDNGDVYLNPSFNDCYPEYLVNDIRTEKENSMVQVFPNPADSEFYIQAEPGANAARALIYDPSGRMVQDEKINLSGECVVHLTASPGIYIILIKGEDGNIISRHRVIKN